MREARPRVLQVTTENSAFQHVEVLKRNRRKRRQYGAFFVEGVRAINLALAHGWEVESFIHARERALSRWARDILAASRARTHLEMAGALVEKLSDREESSELLAVLRMRPDDPARIPVRPGMVVVVADRPASPGNLGTLVRSCDALGADGVIVTGHAADPYDPQTIRASVGSFFALPVVALPSHRELLAWAERVRAEVPALSVVGTSAAGAVPLRGQAFPGATVLLIGNEAAGLSRAYREACDRLVAIPMRGAATSLNMAVAASIALYEIDAWRRASY